ncbi:hypothetical protein IG631_14832 [Alternaria alternata]|nr:hypothetical protein IG631_14832 [Alternaria alternata]
MPAGKAQDCQWRGHSVCHDFTRLRELLRGPQNLPIQVSRNCHKRATVAYSRRIMFKVMRRGTDVHKSIAGSHPRILLRKGLRLAGVGQDTHGQPRYLFDSCSSLGYWSRSFFLLTRASQHSLHSWAQCHLFRNALL